MSILIDFCIFMGSYSIARSISDSFVSGWIAGGVACALSRLIELLREVHT